MDTRTLSATLAAILIVVPSAYAAWSVKGAWEPDTLEDATSSWMSQHPSTGDERVVYFNGFGAEGGAIATTVNPNSALLLSSVHPLPFVPVAMMGIWKDCNQDGFVGLGDDGLLEYRAELLLDDSICPPTVGPPGQAWRAHNTEGWVIELMPIGYDDTRTAVDENPFNLNDTSARVWADWGLPGDAPRLACPTLPAPYGTFRSTGGLLRYADCFAGHQATRSITAAATALGQPGLGFGDAPPDRPDQSASPLNAPNPWGDASDTPMVVVFDCSHQTDVSVADPTDPGDGSGELHTLAVVPSPFGDVYVNATDRQGRVVNASVPDLAPGAPSGGSPAGTVSETEAAFDCDRDDPDETIDLNGERSASDGNLPYELEGDAEPISPFAARTQTDHVLAFEEGSRGGGLPAMALGAASRDDFGLGTHALTGFWVGGATSIGGRNPILSRNALGAEPVTHITYYGTIAAYLLDSVPLTWAGHGATGIYGAEGCERDPPTFECDPQRWWLDTTGADVTPRDARLGSVGGSPTTPTDDDATRIGVRVGQPYFFRDVDCYDQSATLARNGGVHWGRVSGSLCQRPG